jgi:putative endonuclease
MNAELESRPAAYVLRAAGPTEYLYKGSTRDMAARWSDHREGRVARTRNRRPLTLVLVEYFDSFTDARRRELFLKTGVGRAWLKARVAKWQTQGTSCHRQVRLRRKNPLVTTP